LATDAPWIGYVPVDLPATWTRLGFTADPQFWRSICHRVKWIEYQEWLVTLEKIAGTIGLRSYRKNRSGRDRQWCAPVIWWNLN
jgi:hypothetical protein